MRLRRTSLAFAAIAATAALAGCSSQIAALAPVSGDGLTGVRTAATDVVLAQGMSFLRAPVCTQVVKAVTCEGSLMDGTTVTVAADITAKPYTMTVKAGDTTLYDGDVDTVLNDAASSTGGAAS